jgi:hydrogenase maturation protease
MTGASYLFRCLVLACGNTLRGDDGVGPWLADWAHRRFQNQHGFRIISRQQWTPELAEEIARAEAVLFIDCSLEATPGSISLSPVEPNSQVPRLATHHLSAAELLALARELYSALPRESWLLTIGAGSVALGEDFSAAVKAALPHACRRIEETVQRLLAGKSAPQ